MADKSTAAPASDRTVAEELASAMPRLTPAERRIARALLADYPVAGLDTAARLAEAASTSGPTVVRFVKTLGYSSFRDFQSALRGEVQARGESALSQATALPPERIGRSPDLDQLRDAFLRGIEATFGTLIPAEVERAAELLASPRQQIVAFGGTYSGILAELLVAQLVPYRSSAMTFPRSAIEGAALIDDIRAGDVWVAFDFRRYQDSTHRRAELAKSRGAAILLITDRWLSPIARFADVVLTVHVEAAGPSDTLVPAVAVVEAVCERVVERLGPGGLDRLQRLDPVRLALE